VKNFSELDSLIDRYSKEIKNILSEIKVEELLHLDDTLSKIKTVYEKQQMELNKFIHEKYPLQDVVVTDGNGSNHQSNIYNFLAQCQLGKYSNEFYTICFDYLKSKGVSLDE
jgi:hypothetical protein